MPGSGAEAERLKPGWPRRSPRVPPLRLLGMGKQTFYLITALPPPRPPPRGPLPAQPLTPQTQCAAASSAPKTLWEHPARGAAPTHPPTCLPGGLGSPVSPRVPSLHGALLVQSSPSGLWGDGMWGSPLGDQPRCKLLWPQGRGNGETPVQRCPYTVGQAVPVAGPHPCWQRHRGQQTLCHGAAPHTSSLPTLAYPTSPCASPRMPGSRFSLLFVCYGFNWEERPRPH